MSTSKHDTQSLVRGIASQIAQHGRTAFAERAALRNDPAVHRDNLNGVLLAHGNKTAEARGAMAARARTVIAQYRDANVLKSAPDHRPAGAAQASWIGAICSQATAYSPAVLGRTITDAAQRGDTALVAALMPLLESKASYSKPFLSAPESSAALVAGQQCLDNVPEVRASRDAADFADTLEFELHALETVLSSNDPIAGLEQHVAFNALPTILPVSA